MLCVNSSSNVDKLIHQSKAALLGYTPELTLDRLVPPSGFPEPVLQAAWQPA